jgi:hypothetical protein
MVPGGGHYYKYASWATPEEKKSGSSWSKDEHSRELSRAEYDIKKFYKEQPEYSEVTTQGSRPTTFEGVSWDELRKVNGAYRTVAGVKLKGMDQWSKLRKQNGMLEVDADMAESMTMEGWSIQVRLLEGYQKELSGYPEAAAKELKEDRELEEFMRHRRGSSTS